MKIDLNTPILDYKGQILFEKELNADKTELVDTTVKLTFKGKISEALSTPIKDKEDGNTLYKKYLLLKKINENGEVDLSAEDVVLILKTIEIYNSPLLYGQTKELLDK